MRRTAVHPGLYPADGQGAPPLLGGRCRQCERVFFPFQAYGCERCGAPGEALAPAALPGAGTLVARAAVHAHLGGSIETPFAIGEIALDAGPVVRATLADAGCADLPLGARMRSVLADAGLDAEGNQRVELRFAPEAGGEEA